MGYNKLLLILVILHYFEAVFKLVWFCLRIQFILSLHAVETFRETSPDVRSDKTRLNSLGTCG